MISKSVLCWVQGGFTLVGGFPIENNKWINESVPSREASLVGRLLIGGSTAVDLVTVISMVTARLSKCPICVSRDSARACR